MDLYKCAYRDPKSPLTPINPINTQHFQYGTLKSESNHSATPLSSRASDSAKAMALCEPSESTRYYTLVPQMNNPEETFSKISSNVSSTSSRDSERTVRQKVTEKVGYQCGKIVEVTRYEKRKETFFKRASPCPRHLCPKVAEWLRSSGLERYKNLFMNEEVDFKALLLMNEYDLKDLGIFRLDDRIILLDLIRRKRDYWNFQN